MKKYFVIQQTLNLETGHASNYLHLSFNTRVEAEAEARRKAGESDNVWTVAEVLMSFESRRIVSKL